MKTNINGNWILEKNEINWMGENEKSKVERAIESLYWKSIPNKPDGHYWADRMVDLMTIGVQETALRIHDDYYAKRIEIPQPQCAVIIGAVVE